MLQRFQYPNNGILRTDLNEDGQLIFCLHDVCNILGYPAIGLTTSQVMNRINPRQKIKRKLDTGSLAWFISFPEIMSLPDKISRTDRYELRKLSNFIKKDVIPFIDPQEIKNRMLESNTLNSFSDSGSDYSRNTSKGLPQTYTEALRELADTTERLECMKSELYELKQASYYVRELTTLVERTLMLNGIRL